MDSLILSVKYVFLGLLQGFTEPIPVSSSGHLVIAEHLMGLRIEGLSFEVLVNFASLLAILLIYRQDITQLIQNGWKFVSTKDPESKSDFKFIMYLIMGTIPAGVIGFLFNDLIADALKGTAVIGMALLVTGVFLWLIRNLKGRKSDKDLSWKDAILVGLAQAIALIPGISRSGATIVASMGLGMRQATALKFSFLLYIPVSVGGMILEGSNLLHDPELSTLAIPYILAFICSFIASYISLRWFMGIMERGNLKWFAYYCFVAGVAVLVFL